MYHQCNKTPCLIHYVPGAAILPVFKSIALTQGCDFRTNAPECLQEK